jgi:hypothetical protein
VELLLKEFSGNYNPTTLSYLKHLEQGLHYLTAGFIQQLGHMLFYYGAVVMI